MALKSTIFKANLSIADIDHGYYADHNLTLARHPSETDERMMVRLVALALNAWQLQALCQGDGTLAFGTGLSDPDDPDVHITDFTGAKRLWIEVGQPEEKPLSKACSKADHVLLYPFGPAAEVWWKGMEGKVGPPKKTGRLAHPGRHRAGTGRPGAAQHAAASDDSRGRTHPVQRARHGGCGTGAVEVTCP